MKIIIADDHALLRDGLRLQVEALFDGVKVFEASTYEEAIGLAKENPDTDVVLIDLEMPEMGWKQGIPSIISLVKKGKIIIISASENYADINKALNMGISGYIPKNSATKILVSAIRLVLEGGTYLPTSLLQQKETQENIDSDDVFEMEKELTVRQKQVLECLGKGLSNKQIAYEMSVSEATVKLHINALLRNLKVTNRTQAVITAQKMGLL